MLIRYIVDTSTWIAWIKHYPRPIFPTLVDRHEKLIKDGRIVSPAPVFDEICRGNDEVVQWARRHRGLFVPRDDRMVGKAAMILADHPYLGRGRGRRESADPYLIALALLSCDLLGGSFRPVIVSEENKTSGIKIPLVAKHYNIDTYNTFEMFSKEDWIFCR